MIVYQKKLIKSGNFYEFFEYEKPIFKGLLSKIGNTGNGSCQARGEQERRRDNLAQTQAELRRLINSNPWLDKFLTLTFRKNITDLTKANYEFKKFRQRMETETGRKFSFITVVEFQKRGAVHYHTLCKLPFLTKQEISNTWGQGFVQINRVSHVDNLGAYVSKYLTKETMKLRGRKKYFHSNDCDYPEETVNPELIDFVLNSAKFKTADLRYTCKWESPIAGEVKYSQFLTKEL